MISNPKYGWCDFKLGNFEGTPSYLTDVPFDLLNAFLDYHYKGAGMAWFDEEGTEFTLVITPYSMFIIAERDGNPVLHDFSELNVSDLENELMEDIESDMIGWSEFIIDDDREEIMIHRDSIWQRIAKLRKFVPKR